MAEARQSDRRRAGGRKSLGPLHGVPIALKDNIDTAGVRTTGASKVFLERVPAEDAEVARRLKVAGAVCLGTQSRRNGFRGNGYHQLLRPSPQSVELGTHYGRIFGRLGGRSGCGAMLCLGRKRRWWIGSDPGLVLRDYRFQDVLWTRQYARRNSLGVLSRYDWTHGPYGGGCRARPAGARGLRSGRCDHIRRARSRLLGCAPLAPLQTSTGNSTGLLLRRPPPRCRASGGTSDRSAASEIPRGPRRYASTIPVCEEWQLRRGVAALPGALLSKVS